ncbi:FecR domain-containing protein [Sphingobium sufflavum]|uniref:FecR family protein n=1 Tax=Sphingobium sufflavum TaxID=1129547 RepID=UPI001F1CB7FF|nr:FecR domain-containing protein [Sphingobium sufflavum]MCE7796369.1 FecR domain-containing protein [Sphingobium sufflavum]
MTDARPDPRPDLRDDAVAWHLAAATMDAERWLAFTTWLEADPAHAAAYDAVALADRRLAQAAPRLASVAASPAPGRHIGNERHPAFARARFARLARRPLWIGAACAASIAALLLVTTLPHGAPDARYAVATPAGTSRTIAMDDGSTVALNGATRIALDRDNPRLARLEQGEALFTVRHDAARPFTVMVGRFRVEDLGTVFNIVRDRGRLSVSVAEGRVLFDPDGARLTLGPGDAVTVDEAQNMVTRSIAKRVGGWQSGDMEFTDVPLADVASAIHRATGTRIVIAAPLSRTPFTGNIHVSGKAGADARHLADLVGADVHRDGEKWLLSSPPGTP